MPPGLRVLSIRAEGKMLIESYFSDICFPPEIYIPSSPESAASCPCPLDTLLCL